MNDRRNQADALDRFFDRLAHDPQAETPDELDRDTAQFARDLAQALRVPPLDTAQHERIRQAAQSRRARPRVHEEDHTHMNTAATQLPTRPGWSARALLVLAATLIVVFAGIMTSLYTSGRLDGIRGGAYGSQITPTPPQVTLAPEMPPVPITAANAASLSEVARLGRGAVNQVLWSPDGATLALVGVRGVWLYESGDLSQEPELIDAANISTAHYLTNGDLVALIVDPGDVSARYVNLNTGAIIVDVPTLDGKQIIVPTLSRDGHYLADSTFDGAVAVWDTESGDLVARLFINVNTPALALAFSADGTWLAAGPDDFTVRLWHAPEGDWSAVDGQEPLTLVSTLRSEANVPRLAFDAAGDRLAVAIGDDVEVWDVAQQVVITTLETDDLLQPEGRGGAGQITGLDLSPDGQTAVTTGQITRVWDVTAGAASERPVNSPVLSAVFSPDGERFATLEWNGALRVWVVDRQGLQDEVVAHARSIGDIEYSADGRLLAVNSTISDVHVLNAKTGELYAAVYQPGSDLAYMGFKGMALDPLGHTVATVDIGGAVALWNMVTGRAAGSFLPPAGGNSGGILTLPATIDLPYDCIAFSADGGLVAAASRMGNSPTITVWDAASAEVLHTFTGPGRGALVRDMAFSPDGSRLAVTYESSALSANVIDIWALADGSRQVLEGHTGPVYAVAFSPDGTQIVTGSQDTTARIWDAATGVPVAVLDHYGPVVSVAFSPDGSLLLAGVMSYSRAYSTPASVTVWDAASGNVLVTYPRDGTAVAAFSPDGTQIAVGNADGTISILGIDPAVPPLLGTPPTAPESAVEPTPAFADTLAMSSYPLVLTEAVEPLDAGTIVRVLDLWYADGSWWYTVMATDETTQATVREDQLALVSALPTPIPDAMPGTPAATETPAGTPGTKPAPSVESTDQAPLVMAPITAENVEQLVQIDLIGRGEVSTLAWSPDGGTLAASGYVGIWLYDTAPLETGPRLLPSDIPLSAVAFAPDGTLYTTAFDYTLSRWDVANGTSTVVAEGEPNPYNPRLALHPDGTLAAVGGGDGMIRLYELDSGALRGTLSTNPNTPIDHMAWSADGTRLGATGNDGGGRVWHDSTGTWQTLPADPAVVVLASTAAQMTPQIAFSPDGSAFVTVGGSGTVFWDSGTGEQSGTLDGGVLYGSSGIAYSPDGSQIVTASPDVRLWDLETDASVTLDAPHDLTFGFLMSAVAFHPEGSQIAALGSAGELAVWDIASGTLDGFVPALGYILSVDTSNDGSRIALLTSGGDVALWDVAAGRVVATLSPEDYMNDPAAMSYNVAVALSADAQYVAFGGTLDAVRLWDTAAGTIRQLASESLSPGENTPPLQLYALAFSHDGQRLAAGGTNGIITIWDTATGAQVMMLQAPDPAAAPNSTVFSLSWSPDDTILAAGNGDMGDPQTADFSVRLWDTTSGDVITALEGHTDRVTQVQFSPDGTRLLSVSYGDLRVWSLPDGVPLVTIQARTGALLSNDVLIAMDDGSVPVLYEAATGDILAPGPDMPSESSLIASADGRIVITRGRAGVARVWSVPGIR